MSPESWPASRSWRAAPGRGSRRPRAPVRPGQARDSPWRCHSSLRHARHRRSACQAAPALSRRLPADDAVTVAWPAGCPSRPARREQLRGTEERDQAPGVRPPLQARIGTARKTGASGLALVPVSSGIGSAELPYLSGRFRPLTAAIRNSRYMAIGSSWRPSLFQARGQLITQGHGCQDRSSPERGKGSFHGRWPGSEPPVPRRCALAAVSFLLARRFRCSGRGRPCAPGRLAIGFGGAVRTWDCRCSCSR